MHVEQGFAEINGTQLYYERAGTGVAVVLIHGFPLDTRMWDDQFTTFAQHYHVLRYDVRGFGRSAVPADSPYSHAEDVHALLVHLEIEQATLIGMSMGGMIAIDFALAYPEATHALVSVDAGPAGFRFSQQWNTLMEPIWRDDVDIATKKERWLAHPLFIPAMEQATVAARMREMVADYSGWHWCHHDSVQYRQPPAVEHLSRISAPTLVVLGERDLPDVHVIADLLQQQLPHGTTVRMPHVGHMANMEAPKSFNDIMLNFLAPITSPHRRTPSRES